jgi:ABC-type glycerol-3-phosphate transport system permease component
MQPFALDAGMLMALSVISAIPPVIFFLAAQKWIVQELTAGALKG